MEEDLSVLDEYGESNINPESRIELANLERADAYLMKLKDTYLEFNNPNVFAELYLYRTFATLLARDDERTFDYFVSKTYDLILRANLILTDDNRLIHEVKTLDGNKDSYTNILVLAYKHMKVIYPDVLKTISGYFDASDSRITQLTPRDHIILTMLFGILFLFKLNFQYCINSFILQELPYRYREER